MRMLKKMARTALILTAALALALPAAAADPAVTPDGKLTEAPAVTGEGNLTLPRRAVNVPVWGTVTHTEDGRLLLESPTVGPVVVGVGPQTYIVDAVSGLPVALKDIADGESVYMWLDLVMALSMPPQTGAQLIVAKLPADFGAPAFYQVTQAVWNAEGTALTLHTDKEENLVLDGTVTLFPYLTREIVLLDALQPGRSILVWRQNGPEGEQPGIQKVMTFPYAYAGWVEADAAGGLSFNGQPVDMGGYAVAPAEVESQGALAPLRWLAELAGWDVAWDHAAQKVTLSLPGAPERTLELTIGGETVPDQAGGEDYLSRAPELRAGRTVMALPDIARLLGLYLAE